jgi:hypothetical protein
MGWGVWQSRPNDGRQNEEVADNEWKIDEEE